MVSTARHHGPPPPRPRHARGPVHAVDPRQSMPTCCPTPLTSTPPLTRCSRKFWGRLSSSKSPGMGDIRRRGPFGSLTPVRCAKRSRDLALLWAPVARPVASIFLPKRTCPRAALGMSLPPRLPSHPPRLQSWLSQMPRRVPPGTRLTPPPSQSCRCCVCSPTGSTGKAFFMCSHTGYIFCPNNRHLPFNGYTSMV